MKLLIFGNIGSGKSAICSELVLNNADFILISVDEFRHKYGDGSMRNEIEAKFKFIEAIDTGYTNQIIECSGLGDTGEMVYERLSESDDTKIVIVLLCDIEICKKRLNNRIWAIPYPDKTSNVNILLEKQELFFQGGLIQQKWEIQKDVIYFALINNTKIEFINNCLTIKNVIDEARRNNWKTQR
jgi:broad-specificity NMP kinase